MTQDQELKSLETWLKCYKDLDKQFIAVNNLTGMTIDSPFGEVVWRSFERYTAILSDSIGDHGSWLDWYVYDNQCGERGFEVDINGKTTKIRTLKQLLKAIKGDK
jgi:hypothetical protein